MSTIDPLAAAEFAIREVESRGSGDFSALGPVIPTGMYKGDRAYGAFQVMGKNVPSWTKRYYGQELTPEEFLGNEEAQRATFRGKFAEEAERFGSFQDAASVWFTGQPYSIGKDRRDVNISGQEYIRRFNNGLRKFAEQRGAAADSLTGLLTGNIPGELDPSLGNSPSEGNILRNEGGEAGDSPYMSDFLRQVSRFDDSALLNDFLLPPEAQPAQAPRPQQPAMPSPFVPQTSPAVPSSMTAPQAPMTGPRSGLVDGALPNLPTIQTAPAAPRSVPEGATIKDIVLSADPEALADTVNAVFPSEGGPETLSLLDETVKSALVPTDYGLTDETAPASIAEAIEVSNEQPAEDESETKANRRMMAADMLEVLSVGLGQIAAGQGVNLAPSLNAQAQRYQQIMAEQAAAEQQAAEAAQMEQQARTVASELASMGLDGMARVAMSGPDGLQQAMRTLGQVSGREPATLGTMGSMSAEQRAELLTAVGVPANTAMAAAQFPDLAMDVYAEAVRPDPQAAQRADTQQGVMRQIEALTGIAGPYAYDPGVQAAATSAYANPTEENAKAYRDALAQAGASAAELAASPKDTLSEGTAALLRAAGVPDEAIQAGLADPEAAELLRKNAGQQLGPLFNKDQPLSAAEAAELEALGMSPDDIALGQQDAAVADRLRETAQQVRDDASTKTDAVRTLEALQDNPELAQLDAERRRTLSAAGTPAMRAADNRFDALEERSTLKAQELDIRQPMVRGMMQVLSTITADGYDRSSGGPLNELLGFSRDFFAQTMGEEFADAIQDGDVNFAQRQLKSYIGQYFSNFRAVGSGATSDMESKLFLDALPSLNSSALKQAGIAQMLIRSHRGEQTVLAAQRDYALRNLGDADALGNEAALQDHVQSSIEAANIDLIPMLDETADGYSEALRAGIQSGNIDSQTVIRVIPAEGGEPRYVFAKDYFNELGISLPGGQ